MNHFGEDELGSDSSDDDYCPEAGIILVYIIISI